MTDQTISIKPAMKYVLLRCTRWIMIAAIIPAIALYFNTPILLLAMTLPGMVILYRIIYWRQVKYEISREQIRYSRGIWHRQTDFLEMFRIKDFDQRQTLPMQMLGVMHIRLMTSDITHPVLELKGIPVSNITDMLRQLVEEARRKNRVYAID